MQARFVRPLTALVALIPLFTTPARAASTVNYNATSGNWGNPASWNPQQVPAPPGL